MIKVVCTNQYTEISCLERLVFHTSEISE